jgi:hypothetical protein
MTLQKPGQSLVPDASGNGCRCGLFTIPLFFHVQESVGFLIVLCSSLFPF